MLLLEELSRDSREAYFRLYYDRDLNTLVSQWLGLLTQKELQMASHKTLQHIANYQSPTFLLDHSNNLNDWQEVCTWVQVLWTPKRLDFEWYYFAHVLAEKDSVEADFPMKDVVHAVIYQVFDNLSEAKEWLQTRSQHKLEKQY